MIVFPHRSFQEYFAARFICESTPELQEKLINRYSKNLHMDSVMRLLYEMNPELVERTYVIPGINKLEEFLRIRKAVGITHYLHYIKSQYTQFRITQDHISGLVAHNEGFDFRKLLNFTVFTCGHLIGWAGMDKDKYAAEVTNFLNKYGSAKKEARIDISGMSYRDPFIRDLALSHSFFSKHTLESALAVKAELVKKHKNIQSSLDEILKG